ncbi:MAG: ATP-dependent helicase, partial [Nocardioidaceae bacterium]|nr:ATP-dependent helicase [Nocardioidaceae bacterium]
MSFVPLTGPATLRPGEPPVIEFTDQTPGARTVALPVAAALPVLSKAHGRADAHPSVALLSGAALLGLRLVAAGKVAPQEADARASVQHPARAGWRMGGLDERDRDAVRRLASARCYDDLGPADAEVIVRGLLDAVADTLPPSAPAVPLRRPAAGGEKRPARTGSATGTRTPADFAARVQERLAERVARAAAEQPQEPAELVRISLRVEAEEEELAAATVRVVLQVHDERDPLHVCDAALLWTADTETHGFGERARIHASIALRAAADVWTPLDRFLALAVPDQLALDGEEIASLLSQVGALRDAGVDVHWPRSLGPELTTRAVLDRRPDRGNRSGKDERNLELPLEESPFGTESLFAFSWQAALRGDPLTEEEMSQLAAAASPIIKLRGAWTVADPTTAQRARKRLIRKATGAQALAAALTGTTEVPAGASEEDTTAQVVVGASVLKVREQVLEAATRTPLPTPAALAATLRDYQRHGLTWMADLTGLGLGACLADDMGLGKTVTLIALHLQRL